MERAIRERTQAPARRPGPAFLPAESERNATACERELASAEKDVAMAVSLASALPAAAPKHNEALLQVVVQ
jgi:hypothetical protein